MQDTFRHLGSKIVVSSSDNDAVANKLPTDNRTLTDIINSVGKPSLNLDASNQSTITKNASNVVSAWLDLSDSGNHGTTIEGSPIWEAAGERLDVPSVRFNGAQSIAGSPPFTNYPYTLVLVGNVATNDGPMIAFGSSSVNNRYITINWGQNHNNIRGAGDRTGNAKTNYPNGVSNAAEGRGIFVCRAANFQYRDIRVNSFWSASNNTDVGCPSINRYRLGRNADQTTTEYSSCNIMQVIVWSHYIDDDSIRPLEKALMAYWKIPTVRP